MSKEQDRATNKSLRVGISGENPLPDLTVFTVTQTIAYQKGRFDSGGSLQFHDGSDYYASQYNTVTNMAKTVIDQTGVPGSYWDGLMTADIQATLDDLARESIASGGNASIWSVSPDGQLKIEPISPYIAPHKGD